MPHFGSLDLWGSVLSFVGGALLSYDPLTAKRRVVAESGARLFLRAARRLNLKNIRTPAGENLDSEESIKAATAARSETLARYGFLVMTVGFLLDLVAKW